MAPTLDQVIHPILHQKEAIQIEIEDQIKAIIMDLQEATTEEFNKINNYY